MDPSTVWWLSVGPSAQPFPDYGKLISVSGRTTAIAVSPDSDGTGTPAMYIGIDGGGVWRSTDFRNAQPDWTPLTDHMGLIDPDTNQPLTAPAEVRLGTIHSIAVGPPLAPGRPWRVYVANDTRYLLVSYDGGNTWNPVRIRFLFDGLTRQFNTISKVFVDPTDSAGNTLYVLGTIISGSSHIDLIMTGSYDGKSWQWQPVPTPGGQLPLPKKFIDAGLRILDLEYTIRGSTLTLWALLYDETKQTTVNNAVWSWANDGSRPLSSNPITFVDAKGKAVDPTSMGHSRLAASHAPSTDAVYLAVADDSQAWNVLKFNPVQPGLSHGTFDPVGNGLAILDKSSGYAMGVSPDGVVYIGGLGDIYQLVADTAAWANLYPPYNKGWTIPHSDCHAWGYDNGAVYRGDDGGIWRFNPLPNKQSGLGSWEALNTSGLATNLAYGIGLHPTDPKVLLVTCQDNGISMRKHLGGWAYAGGTGQLGAIPDMWKVRFDTDPKKKGMVAYATGFGATTYESGLFYVSTNGGHSFTDVSTNLKLDKQNYPDVSGLPFAIDPTTKSGVLLGIHEVWKTDTQGAKWRTISPDLRDHNGLISDRVNALGVFGKFIVAATGSSVFVSLNGGGDGSWSNWYKIKFAWLGQIEGIAIDSHIQAQNLYKVFMVTAEGLGYHVYRLVTDGTDAGTKVDDLTASLSSPSLQHYPVGDYDVTACIALQSVKGAEPLLFVGNDQGVWFLDSGAMADWQPLTQGLPEGTLVTDLHYNAGTGLLAAATYGRGGFVANIAQANIPQRVPIDLVIRTFNMILLGIKNDAPGYFMSPDGHIHPWDPGDPTGMSPVAAVRGVLASLALSQAATRVGDRVQRRQMQAEAAGVLRSVLGRLGAWSLGVSPGRARKAGIKRTKPAKKPAAQKQDPPGG